MKSDEEVTDEKVKSLNASKAWNIILCLRSWRLCSETALLKDSISEVRIVAFWFVMIAILQNLKSSWSLSCLKSKSSFATSTVSCFLFRLQFSMRKASGVKKSISQWLELQVSVYLFWKALVIPETLTNFCTHPFTSKHCVNTSDCLLRSGFSHALLVRSPHMYDHLIEQVGLEQNRRTVIFASSYNQIKAYGYDQYRWWDNDAI